MCEWVLNSDIYLRSLELTDAKPMLEWLKNPDIYEKMQYNPEEQNLEKCITFIKSSWEESKNRHYAIADSTHAYLGTISLKNIDMQHKNAELGIALHPKAMGKGIGADALRLIVKKAFEEMELHKIYLYVRKDNQRAVRFYQKNGWICEGEFKEHLYIRGEFKDICWFALRNGGKKERI